MLRPLLFLSAFNVLAGALQTINTSSVLDISSCPITYYGQKYERLYVNLSNENSAFCFDRFFSREKKGDCIIGKSPDAQMVDFEIVPADSFLERWIRNKTQSIQNSLTCIVQLKMQFNKFEVHLDLFNFMTKAVLSLESHSIGAVLYQVWVGGVILGKVYVENYPDSYQIDDSLDLSGCRHSGNVYKPGTVISSDPQSCSKLTCSETAVLQTSACGPLERCQGNGICMSDTTCTVTGPSVIDIHGQVNSIKDRCAYSLVSTPLVPDFLILANFQELRRKDVNFLDSVTLRLDGVQIHLEQGGRVQLDNSSSTAQLVHGVELSKDQTGITAKLSLSSLTTSIFFDGYTAQIHFEGPAVASLEGLCGNSSRSLSELRLSEYSSTSCEIQYSDTADSTINCNNVTERCNLLKEAPFTSCNNDIDPEPYITACTDTLCQYPAVDGLSCQFLKAYARVCSLHNSHTLEGWTSNAGCSPEAFCQDRTCSDHEFCGETVGGDTRCFCRAIFASKYRSTDSFGDPTVCRENSASLTLVGCLLEDKGIDYSALHLNDQTCRGQMDEVTHMVTFSFSSSNSCGTVVTANSSHIVYKNTIKTQNSFSDIITRNDEVYIDFSCTHIQPNINTATFRIKDWSVAQKISSGAWNYTLTIKAYTDADRTQVVMSNSEVRLNQKIWVEVQTDGLDGDMVAVVSDSCWATDQPSPSSSPRHDLIINGCANPADLTVEVEENGVGTSTCFSFNMFRFTGGSGDVFLHCKLHLCPKLENSCVPTCNKTARRRRSASYTYEPEAPAFVGMSWTN